MSWAVDRLAELRFEIHLWIGQQQIIWFLIRAASPRKHILGCLLLWLIVNATPIAFDVVATAKKLRGTFKEAKNED